MNTHNSEQLFTRAQKIIPGGVNSPVRAFKSVGGVPRFFAKADGAKFWDVDGNEYIDFMMSWGPLILGHSYPSVIASIKQAALRGTSFGGTTEGEVELAEMVIERFPAAEMVRLVSSGTEATMTAIRLARAFTGREIMVKFDGCYHGHSDALLVKAGSGLATQGIAGSAGVPASTAKAMISLPYNNIGAVEKAFESKGAEIAGIIVEPVAANMGVIPPAEGFLEGLRHLTAKYDSVLIFDEVISGFRVARGGASELYSITPDLICLGKILGGGLPIGGVGGKREIMERLAPLGDVYQAGTLSGNPISVAAGIATLKELDRPRFYDGITDRTEKLADALRKRFAKAGIPVIVNHLTGLLTLFFGTGTLTDYESVQKCDMERFARFHAGMMEKGIYLPPSGYEAWFISSAHGSRELQKTADAVKEVAESL